MKNFYKILNVDANATLNEIKEAYKNLSERFQPFLDQHDKFLKEEFREICNAYQVLSDPVSRRNYDQELKEIKFIPLKEASKVRRSFFKTRTIDVTFTAVLGLLTFVFGYYVISSVRSFKAAKFKKTLVASTVSLHKTYRHPYKHHLKTAAKSPFPKIQIVDTTKVPFSPKAPVVQTQIYTDKNSIGNPVIAAAVPDEVKPASVIVNTEKHPIKEAFLPYTTYLRANETGVINMRKFDNYGSEIIKVVPTNAEVSVLEKGTVYYKVLFDNTTGYVARWNVLKK